MTTASPSLDLCQAFIDGLGPFNNLDKALLSKMTAAQLRERLRQEKASMDAFLAERAKLASARATLAARGETSVANNRLKQATKPSAPAPRAIAPAAKAPAFPLLSKLETLKGSQAVAFIKANQTAISIEQRHQRFR